MADRVPARLSATDGRRFGLTVGATFLMIALLAWWRGRPQVGAALAVAGALLLVGGVALPARLAPVFRAWMGLGQVLSAITTPLFLGIVFFLVVTPSGWLMRMFGSKPLPSPERGSSGWIRRLPETRRGSDMRHQF